MDKILTEKRILIDLSLEIVDVIDRMAKETGRTRKTMCQILIITKLKELNYKPQLSLTAELK